MRIILEWDDFFDKQKLWYYIPIDIEVLDYFFKSINNKSQYNFVELGSGEGRNCFYASNYFKKVYGIEIYDEYYNKSIEIQNAKEPIHLELEGEHETIAKKDAKIVDKGVMNDNIKFFDGDILNQSILNQIPKEKSVVFTYQPFMNASCQNLPTKSEEGITARKQYDKLVHMYYEHFPVGSIFFFNDCYLVQSNYKGMKVKPYLPMYDSWDNGPEEMMNIIVKA